MFLSGNGNCTGLGCGSFGCTGLGCGGLGAIEVPGVDPQIQRMVIYGAVALVIFGAGFYLLTRR